MTNDNAVASVDASEDINLYVQGLCRVVEDHIKRGFEAYMISFMFKLAMLTGSNSANAHGSKSHLFSVPDRMRSEPLVKE